MRNRDGEDDGRGRASSMPNCIQFFADESHCAGTRSTDSLTRGFQRQRHRGLRTSFGKKISGFHPVTPLVHIVVPSLTRSRIPFHHAEIPSSPNSVTTFCEVQQCRELLKKLNSVSSRPEISANTSNLQTQRKAIHVPIESTKEGGDVDIRSVFPVETMVCCNCGPDDSPLLRIRK